MFLGTELMLKRNFNDSGEIGKDVQIRDCNCYILREYRTIIYRHASRGKSSLRINSLALTWTENNIQLDGRDSCPLRPHPLQEPIYFD
jgi:hypothetical protein